MPPPIQNPCRVCACWAKAVVASRAVRSAENPVARSVPMSPLRGWRVPRLGSETGTHVKLRQPDDPSLALWDSWLCVPASRRVCLYRRRSRERRGRLQQKPDQRTGLRRPPQLALTTETVAHRQRERRIADVETKRDVNARPDRDVG